MHEAIMLMQESGMNPIACCQMYGEPVFVFETTEEAMQAYDKFELGRQLMAYWYGKEEFEKAVNLYEFMFGRTPEITQINGS